MWGRYTKSGLQLESVLQEPLRTDVCKTWVSAVAFLVSSHSWTTDSVRSVSPGLKTKRTGLLLSGPKLCSLMKVNFAFPLEIRVPEELVWRKRGEAQNPRCLRSSVKFPQSVMVWGAMSSAGVGPLCFLRSKVNTAVYQEVLEHFMLLAADQLYGDADFIFQQDLAPAHSAKATSTWFKDHGIPVLNWPANSPDLNPIENLWGIVKRKMRYARPNNAEELKATIRATWALITPEQCHRLIHNTWLHATPHCCSNSGKRSPNYVLSAVHAHTFHVHTFQLAKISKNPFFVLVLSNILIFWDTEFGVFISCQL